MRLFSLFVLLLSAQQLSAQYWAESHVADFPEPVSNNAVCEGFSAQGNFIYSFAGIDSTLHSSGIHLKCWRMNTQTLQVDVLPDLPDTLGKIAAAASRVGNTIYIIGGYHVFPNGSELSSDKVHRFDIAQNQFLTDGSAIPTPIDDHVQAVYKDSLIFVVTGWSNTGNVPDVQIYNTYTDSWQLGTSTPNNNRYKCFGASGEIIGDTIYYFGGAAGLNFAAQSELRKGYIDPLDPTNITWSEIEPSPTLVGYRSAACLTDQGVHWLGGSNVTYNYNAIAYNGTGLVTPANHSIYYHPNGSWGSESGTNLPMDLRGVANITEREKMLVGGIGSGGEVSSAVIRLEYSGTLDIEETAKEYQSLFYPNPSKGLFNSRLGGELKVSNLLGAIVHRQTVRQNDLIELSHLESGIYITEIYSGSRIITDKLVIER